VAIRLALKKSSNQLLDISLLTGSAGSIAESWPVGSRWVTIRATPGDRFAERPLEVGRLAMGLFERQRLVHLKVEFQRAALLISVDANSVRAQPGAERRERESS